MIVTFGRLCRIIWNLAVCVTEMIREIFLKKKKYRRLDVTFQIQNISHNFDPNLSEKEKVFFFILCIIKLLVAIVISCYICVSITAHVYNKFTLELYTYVAIFMLDAVHFGIQ